MELVLIGLGGCSGYDVVHILEKGREAIEDVAVELEAERARQDPKVFTRVHMHFVVKGRGLIAEKVERAIALSVEKYCSASAMIAKTATISHDFEVVDTATEAGAR
jgi:putative redox protein